MTRKNYNHLVIAVAVFLGCQVSILSTAFAWTLFLKDDLGINGLFHYCRYSDGQTYSLNAVDLCPLTMEGAAPGFGQGTGFLKGQYQDGMSKVCVYDVMGQKQALRLGSTELCPLTSQF